MEAVREIAVLRGEKQKLCAQADVVREKLTGVVLDPGNPAPTFDVGADPLSAPERIILMFYNWCHSTS